MMDRARAAACVSAVAAAALHGCAGGGGGSGDPRAAAPGAVNGADAPAGPTRGMNRRAAT